MNIGDFILSAAFCFIMVIALLASLYALVKLSTSAIQFFESISKK